MDHTTLDFRWRMRMRPGLLNRMAKAIGPAAYDRKGRPIQTILVGGKRTGQAHNLLHEKVAPRLDTALLVAQCLAEAEGIDDPKTAFFEAWEIISDTRSAA